MWVSPPKLCVSDPYIADARAFVITYVSMREISTGKYSILLSMVTVSSILSRSVVAFGAAVVLMCAPRSRKFWTTSSFVPVAGHSLLRAQDLWAALVAQMLVLSTEMLPPIELM